MAAVYTTGGSRAGRFAAGVGLGLPVLPLTLFLAGFLGAAVPLLPPVAFLALAGGAMALPPFSGARVAGVLTGIAAPVVLTFGFFALLFTIAPVG